MCLPHISNPNPSADGISYFDESTWSDEFDRSYFKSPPIYYPSIRRHIHSHCETLHQQRWRRFKKLKQGDKSSNFFENALDRSPSGGSELLYMSRPMPAIIPPRPVPPSLHSLNRRGLSPRNRIIKYQPSVEHKTGFGDELDGLDRLPV
jgi:hypothetical protein